MSRKLTKEEFIRKSQEIHGKKYDYTKVDYINNRTKVCIICPEHGEFWQVAGEHLRGRGCVKCAGKEILTQDDFFKKCFEKYGDKYDYSKAMYKGTKEKITILCREHGEFRTTPSLHLKWGACPLCRKEKITRFIEREEFIKLAREVHGDKYDYPQLPERFRYYDDEIEILCPTHGYFTTTAYLHLVLKRGCKKCVFRGLTTEEWIERFKEIHGDKYDYSKFVYQGTDVKSSIICKKHGEFKQTPGKHLLGRGCPECKWDRLHDLNCKTTEQFIKEAREVHGERYDYSKVEYKKNNEKVCIICPEHGEFWQKPTSHILQKNGCKKCATIADTPRRQDTKESFSRKANKTHNNKYDYSKVEYVDSLTPVCIICPKHGEFWQRPDSHINGRGCPKCGKHKTEELMCRYLDKIGIKYEYEKRFEWLSYKGKQRLDFYFPEANIAIERQGEGHSLPIDFGGKGLEESKKDLEYRIKLDQNKKKMCEEHGIKVYYIEYYEDYKQRLDEILRENNLLK